MSDPVPLTGTAVKELVLGLQIEVAEMQDSLAETTRVVNGLKSRLARTQGELAHAKEELEEVALYASGLSVELDQQYEHIAGLYAKRRGNSHADEDEDADDEDEDEDEDGLEGGAFSLRSVRVRKAAKNKNVKFVVKEAIRKTMDIVSLKPAALPKYGDQPAALDSDSDTEPPVRYAWDESAEDARNVKAVHIVTEYVVNHGKVISPRAGPSLKALDRDDIQILVTLRFKHLGKKFLERRVVLQHDAQLDKQLAARAAGERGNDDMQIDADAAAEAAKIQARNEKAKQRAKEQGRKKRAANARALLRERLPPGDKLLQTASNHLFAYQLQSPWETDPENPGQWVVTTRTWETAEWQRTKRIEERDDLKGVLPGEDEPRIARRLMRTSSSTDDLPMIQAKTDRVRAWMVNKAWLTRHPKASKRVKAPEAPE